ncbi:ABC transporter ATP-binding protein [Exiguobacterium flavidum]|uniref:ABC transporter ATP-binding protein n=1 Tax=Exiguobacterium flavidum TaxID=2184695 RepID=UPI0018E5925D|nr:ABC transporter ATP-binding protein [Exiguobacterium flavidum]
MAIIEAVDYGQSYGKYEVLRQLSFSVDPGTITGLLGASGSGKTTLVKAMIGMLRPTRGEISVLGKRMPNLKTAPRIGYMAQNDALYDELSARENLSYFGRLYHLRGDRLERRMDQVLAFVGLSEAKMPVKLFSGGMRRRLSLAIALVHEPELLFLDEPTVGIDPVLKETFWTEFAELKTKGVTLFVTTHVMDEAMRCDRLLMLRNGEIVADGTPQELIAANGTLDAVFLKGAK